jgi:hypothetical protein
MAGLDPLDRHSSRVSWPQEQIQAPSSEENEIKKARQRVVYMQRFMDSYQSMQAVPTSGKVDLDATTKRANQPKIATPNPEANPSSPKLVDDINNFLKALFSVIQAQKSSREVQRGFIMELIQAQQKIERSLQTEKFDLKANLLDVTEKSKTTDKVSIGLTIGLAVAFIGGVIATIFTAGAALPLVIAGVTGGLGIAQGANTIAKGKFDAEMKETESKLLGVREQSTAAHDRVRDGITQSKQESSQAVTYDKWQREALDNFYKTSSQVFGG